MPDKGNEHTIKSIDEYLSGYLALLPGLVWRIDIVGNEITFLNTHAIPSLGERAKAVLQNPQQARHMIQAEDRADFESCYRQIRNRKACACMFRMRLENDSYGWFKMMAMPDPECPTCSIGLLMDISHQVSSILSSEGRPPLCDRLEIQEDPALLISFDDRTVFMANAAARKLLQYDKTQITKLDTRLLFGDNAENKMFEIYENLIFSDNWTGELNVRDKIGRAHQCTARIKAVSRNEQKLLWVTLVHRNNCTACKGVPVRGNETVPSKTVRTAMKKSKTVKELLAAMLDALPESSPTSGIMLSHISIDKNEVAVTGIGEPFESVPENRTHPYEGSIAENIVRFNLDRHVVMETSKSIKPIDWALFIPRGIQSYYAHPFFTDGVLTDVLIFCSSSGGSYDPDADAPLKGLYPDFLSNLTRCRKKSGA